MSMAEKVALLVRSSCKDRLSTRPPAPELATDNRLIGFFIFAVPVYKAKPVVVELIAFCPIIIQRFN
ncbi:unnamed protein product [Soboliphyme baturini]|uniref:Uncharacterized protein n=1 Tax=Soboliphyme baturini TaxID=241478 RepID=A0A183J1G0_9BILA|nr:unnamed protein product [Soboliphyme baturini]